MEHIRYKEGYKSTLSIKENEIAIKEVRRYFENTLAEELNLTRVTAPLFVLSKTGINDDLNGNDVPVNFKSQGISRTIEIVHSLAKWKRLNISKYGFNVYEGLYTNMNAIRKDEIRDNYHSIYVDQWDYEFIISEEDRNLTYLKKVVEKIYKAILKTRDFTAKTFQISAKLPQNITFMTSQQLLEMYPSLSPEERVNEAVRELGALFVAQIGYPLSDGKPHDLRAPDYDDWKLNGDIFLYNEVLDDAIEISSMGIRVNKDSLIEQTKYSKKDEHLTYFYQQQIIRDKLPLTLGGGIGQSRLCLLLLKKLHIGEVQSSIWEKETYDFCASKGINLL